MEIRMFEIGIVTQFEAAHRLQGDFGPAARLHGHTYRVEVSVHGDDLRADGTLCDIALLQTLVQAAIDPLHYRNLDETDAFAGKNSTAEQVALYLFERVAPELGGQGLAMMAVTVWESPQAFARYAEAL
jgi:6-pyruvoyltetrahydropterin/6-carboxytetrahydropterin synthase